MTNQETNGHLHDRAYCPACKDWYYNKVDILSITSFGKCKYCKQPPKSLEYERGFLLYNLRSMTAIQLVGLLTPFFEASGYYWRLENETLKIFNKKNHDETRDKDN